MAKRRKRLPSLPIKALSSKSRKLSVAEKDRVIELFAHGFRPPEVRDWLRKEQGVQVTTNALSAYLGTHKAEIAERRKLWNADMDSLHIRQPRARVEELARAYALMVREFYRVMCPACAGVGTTIKKGRTEDSEWTSVRCMICKGHKWVLPADAVAYDLGDDAAEGAMRLANSPPPPGFNLEVWSRAQAILEQIRREVGDAEPERGKGGGEAPEIIAAMARADAVKALASNLSSRPSSEIVEILRQLGSDRKAIDVTPRK